LGLCLIVGPHEGPHKVAPGSKTRFYQCSACSYRHGDAALGDVEAHWREVHIAALEAENVALRAVAGAARELCSMGCTCDVLPQFCVAHDPMNDGIRAALAALYAKPEPPAEVTK
jgi:alkylhydroperoxidase family enzyme